MFTKSKSVVKSPPAVGAYRSHPVWKIEWRATQLRYRPGHVAKRSVGSPMSICLSGKACVCGDRVLFKNKIAIWKIEVSFLNTSVFLKNASIVLKIVVYFRK